MLTQPQLGLFSHLTHKANLKNTRYGWLRLTPAYSVHLVSGLLDTLPEKNPSVLDPFCGTGTTALVCAERGIHADTIDINPFLIWLATSKTQQYSPDQIAAFETASHQVVDAIMQSTDVKNSIPPIHQIEKWWDQSTLECLGRARHCILDLARNFSPTVIDLLKIAFCRTMIERANVSFGHQSMSFKKQVGTLIPTDAEQDTMAIWRKATTDIAIAAESSIVQEPNILLCDARQLGVKLEPNRYTCVITSPPYPNRMSYIRELRPYMYWLGYLQDAREAGELDWQAIGGTWGSATSNLMRWNADDSRIVPYPQFAEILKNIARSSPLLARYVHKYFDDMLDHVNGLFQVVKPQGAIHYIVGNSKFYDVLLPVEEIFAALFAHVGFDRIEIKTIRKRTSKKELYEYIVSARKP